MSEELLAVAKNFLDTGSNPGIFVDRFISEWKRERDSGKVLSDPPKLSEALSSIFCLADMFNANDDRESYEFDEPRLRLEIGKILKLLE